MYISYITDKQTLGFKRQKDILTGQKFKSFFDEIHTDLYWPTSNSKMTYISQFNSSKLKNHRESILAPSSFLDLCIKIKGGQNNSDLDNKKLAKLAKSIVNKTRKFHMLSINKVLKSFLNRTARIITNANFLTLMGETQKPYQSKLTISPNETSSTVDMEKYLKSERKSKDKINENRPSLMV